MISSHNFLCFSYKNRAFECLHLFFPILTLLKKRGWKIKKNCARKCFDIQIQQIELQNLQSRRFHTRLINFNVKWNLMWWCITGEKWYFVCKTILTCCGKKCSCDRKKLLKFESECWELCKLFEIFWAIECLKVALFLKQNTFLTYFLTFLRFNILEQLEFNWKKMGFRNIQEKLEKLRCTFHW